MFVLGTVIGFLVVLAYLAWTAGLMTAALLFSLAVIAGGTGAYIFARNHLDQDDPETQQPGESWRLIDLRNYSSGSVHLMQSENDGRWIVQTFPTDENLKPKTCRFAAEAKARWKRLPASSKLSPELRPYGAVHHLWFIVPIPRSVRLTCP